MIILKRTRHKVKRDKRQEINMEGGGGKEPKAGEKRTKGKGNASDSTDTERQLWEIYIAKNETKVFFFLHTNYLAKGFVMH